MDKLPKEFLIGSATSAHQIEGGNFKSDWYAWEKIPGHISDGSTSAIAADSWNKWQEDIQLLKKTSQNAYRFSIEWAKIEPREGQFDKDAIKHYRQMLEELKANKIASMVTLFHFTLPLWIDKKGGWKNRQTIKHFANFAGKMAEELGDLVDLWATLNEPNVYIQKGLLEGVWYPGQKKKYLSAIKVWLNFIHAHRAAYETIKQVNTDYQVGCVINMAAFLPAKNSIIEIFLVYLAKLISFDAFIKRIINKCDFLGLNYYLQYRLQAKAPIIAPDNTKKSDYGWFVHPEGIYQIIKESSRWGKPIYITENGIADKEDKLRPKFIKDTLTWLLKALKDGYDLRGYFHWSLIDNFEWSSGYSMNFGLFTIDRKPRKSAGVYKELIKTLKEE